MVRSSILVIASAAMAMFVVPIFVVSQEPHAPSLAPATMPRIGSIDERFQSYNVEMVEVTGGRFWKPYASKADSPVAGQPASNQPAGMDPGLYEYRKPIDLYNPRLRKLAAALGPAYIRVSGTWANTTFFQNTDGPPLASPPKGFNSVLTRSQWKGVVDFSRAVNAEIVTSFAISPGTRDASGIWTPNQARQVVDFTNSIGGRIGAAEFMNEPNFAELGGAPKGYSAADFGRDVVAFHAFAKEALPGLIFLGPGSAGEGTLTTPSSMGTLNSNALFNAAGPAFDAVSFHSYGAVSSRCGSFGAASTTTADAALSDEWLARPDRIIQFYSSIRNKFEPGKPLWDTETAQAACGGDRWASTFLDTFRYLNQLGLSARRGVQVHMHNTLAASDYGLLTEYTFEPRPNYWAAFLWRRLMGATVLDSGPSPATSLHLFAQCLPNHPGGVTLLVINASILTPQTLNLSLASERYTLTAANLQDNHIQLNGADLHLGPNDEMPSLHAISARPGPIGFAPASITFLSIPKAHNASCQ